MNRFVEDVIPSILDSNDHWWGKDLARIALVSPAWLYYVRRRLYASPSLHSFSACAALAQALGSNPYLASLVRHLTLRPTRIGASRSPSKDRMAVRSLLALEGLQSLVLGGELATQSGRFLGFVTSADTLTRLHVDGSLCTSLTSRASLEWSEDLRFRFPNLKTLKITNLEMDIDPPFTSQSLQMDELVLENVSIVSGFLSYLVPEGSTLGRLCINTSSACEYDEHIRMILYSSSVHILEYEVQKPSPSDGLFLEPEGIRDPHALDIRHLELHGLHVDNGVLALVRRWCPGIEELVVSGRSNRLTPEDWEMYLTSGALPSLRRLAVTRGTNHPPYRPWSDGGVKLVTEASCKRSVELFSH